MNNMQCIEEIIKAHDKYIQEILKEVRVLQDKERITARHLQIGRETVQKLDCEVIDLMGKVKQPEEPIEALAQSRGEMSKGFKESLARKAIQNRRDDKELAAKTFAQLCLIVGGSKTAEEVFPKTKLIHGVEVPDISFEPECRSRYYLADVYAVDLFDEQTATGRFYKHWASLGMCYPYTEEGKQAAILHAKAMLGIAEKTTISVKANESLFDRLSKERQELGEKLSKLESFMHRDAFAALTPVSQGLLMVQLEAMRMYADTLDRRIEIS